MIQSLIFNKNKKIEDDNHKFGKFKKLSLYNQKNDLRLN